MFSVFYKIVLFKKGWFWDVVLVVCYCNLWNWEMKRIVIDIK